MKASTYLALVNAMDEIIESENDDRDSIVYDELADEMAQAARLVYNACIDGQEIANRS